MEFEIFKAWDQGLEVCANQFAEVDNTHIFAHPALLKAWIQTYRPIRNLDPIFIKITLSDGNSATMPLVVWHRNWKNAFQKLLIPIGYSDFDYHDPLFLKPIESEQIDQFWAELIDYLKENIDFDSIAIDGITDSMLPTSFDLWEKGEICPLLRLDKINTEDDLMKFFKTSLRGDIRRQIRRISEELGTIELQEYSSWEEIPTSTFESFMAQHSLRWPNAYKAPKFHENLLKYGLENGSVHFSVLKAGEIEIAWHLGFQSVSKLSDQCPDINKTTYYYYMPAGNQEYFKFSPTKIHLYYLVKRAVEFNISVFDHLRGEETYKQGWSNDSHHVNTLNKQSNQITTKIKLQMLKLKSLITPQLANSLFSTSYACNYETRITA